MQENSADVAEMQRALAIATTHRNWKDIEEVMWQDLQAIETRTIVLPLPVRNEEGLISPCGRGSENRIRMIEGTALLLESLGITKKSSLAQHQHTWESIKEITAWLHEQWLFMNDNVPLRGMRNPPARKAAVNEVEAFWATHVDESQEHTPQLPVGTICMGEPGTRHSAYLLASTASPEAMRNVPAHIRSLILAQWACMESRELYSWAWAPNVPIEFAPNARRMPHMAASHHYTTLKRLMDIGPEHVSLRVVNLGVEALVARLTEVGASLPPSAPCTEPVPALPGVRRPPYVGPNPVSTPARSSTPAADNAPGGIPTTASRTPRTASTARRRIPTTPASQLATTSNEMSPARSQAIPVADAPAAAAPATQPVASAADPADVAPAVAPASATSSIVDGWPTAPRPHPTPAGAPPTSPFSRLPTVRPPIPTPRGGAADATAQTAGVVAIIDFESAASSGDRKHLVVEGAVVYIAPFTGTVIAYMHGLFHVDLPLCLLDQAKQSSHHCHGLPPCTFVDISTGRPPFGYADAFPAPERWLDAFYDMHRRMEQKLGMAIPLVAKGMAMESDILADPQWVQDPEAQALFAARLVDESQAAPIMQEYGLPARLWQVSGGRDGQTTAWYQDVQYRSETKKGCPFHAVAHPGTHCALGDCMIFAARTITMAHSSEDQRTRAAEWLTAAMDDNVFWEKCDLLLESPSGILSARAVARMIHDPSSRKCPRGGTVVPAFTSTMQYATAANVRPVLAGTKGILLASPGILPDMVSPVWTLPDALNETFPALLTTPTALTDPAAVNRLDPQRLPRVSHAVRVWPEAAASVSQKHELADAMDALSARIADPVALANVGRTGAYGPPFPLWTFIPREWGARTTIGENPATDNSWCKRDAPQVERALENGLASQNIETLTRDSGLITRHTRAEGSRLYLQNFTREANAALARRRRALVRHVEASQAHIPSPATPNDARPPPTSASRHVDVARPAFPHQLAESHIPAPATTRGPPAATELPEKRLAEELSAVRASLNEVMESRAQEQARITRLEEMLRTSAEAIKAAVQRIEKTADPTAAIEEAVRVVQARHSEEMRRLSEDRNPQPQPAPAQPQQHVAPATPPQAPMQHQEPAAPALNTVMQHQQAPHDSAMPPQGSPAPQAPPPVPMQYPTQPGPPGFAFPPQYTQWPHTQYAQPPTGWSPHQGPYPSYGPPPQAPAYQQAWQSQPPQQPSPAPRQVSNTDSPTQGAASV